MNKSELSFIRLIRRYGPSVFVRESIHGQDGGE